MGKQIYKAFSDLRKLNDAVLKITTPAGVESISIREMIGNFNHEGRVILVSEIVDSLEESSVNNYDHRFFHEEERKIKAKGGRVEFGNLDSYFSFPDEVFVDKEFEINVISFVNTPLIGETDYLNEEQKKIVEFSKLLIVYVVFVRQSNTKLIPADNKYIYESYNQYGFFVVDVKIFDRFIFERFGDGTHNLIEKLTTTELAEDLFARGLIILCWGITPWVYMVTSHVNSQSVMFFPENCDSICSGEYVFSRDIEHASVIPGTELLSWETGSYKDWPEIKLEGTGNVIRLDLRIPRASTSVCGEFIPIPYFNIWRKESEVEKVTPILNFNIFNDAHG